MILIAKKIERIPEVTPEEWEKVNEFNRNITEEFLQQQHLSPHTIVQYESGLKIFFRFIHDRFNNLPLHELKPRHALQYQNFLISKGLSSSAVKFKRSSVSSLCGYLELYYSDEYPLFRNIYSKQIPNPPSTTRHEKKPLTMEEFNHLIEELRKREEWQMVAYVKFSFYSGCRRSEAAQILKSVAYNEPAKDPKTGKDLPYFRTHELRTKGRGKEGEVRRLVYTIEAKNAILEWLEVRGEDDCDHVFVKKTRDGRVRPLSASTFNDWCRNVFSEIVGRRVHPHQLRSSRATILSNEGKDIEKIRVLLGHKSSETTQIYIIKEDEDDISDLF